jgi:hypothetical protein
MFKILSTIYLLKKIHKMQYRNVVFEWFFIVIIDIIYRKINSDSLQFNVCCYFT